MRPQALIVRRGGGSSGGSTPASPTVSLTPMDGVEYTNGIADLDAETMSLIAQAISNNAEVTNTTSVVYFDQGDIHRKVSVGDQITLSLNGTGYAFDIIGFNHDDLTDAAAYGASTATSKAGMTLQMHYVFATTYSMNNSQTNIGGWKDSVMRTSTMATMKGYLPSDWQSIIKPVDKASGQGGGSTILTDTVSDSCFLLSEIEVFNSKGSSVSGEGTQYAYYKAGNSKVKGSYYWWERSPQSGNSNSFCAATLNAAGTLVLATILSANSKADVSFAFCV